MKVHEFDIKFVELLPETSGVLPGTIYVSMKYRTINLRCPCGCGGFTAISLHPTRWAVRFDGKRLTICGGDGGPGSIWNPQLRCGSHYFIRQNRAIFAERIDPSHRSSYEVREKAAMLEHGENARFTLSGGFGAWVRQLIKRVKQR